MRILRVHNRYQQRGGEDTCFEAECDLLRRHGHDVQTLVVSNETIPESPSLRTSLGLATTTVWSRSGRRDVSRAVHDTNAEIVHFDNTFPLISPAAYSAAKEAGAAVVQTLHNYRFICAAYTLQRDGLPCEACLGRKVPLPAIQHACYRGSRTQSAVVAGMLAFHSFRGTWAKDVDRYIALTEFARRTFVDHGFPRHLISVKPNFVDRAQSTSPRDPASFLFVGRLSPEKGISTLVDASRLTANLAGITVIGDGPMLLEVLAASTLIGGLRALGRQPPDDVQVAMDTAAALVFPSTWYEGFPMTILEAFASGLPVIASRLGAMAEIIDDGQTGILFDPGNADALAEALKWAATHPDRMTEMGRTARKVYEARYAPERNYQLLMEIYEQATTPAPTKQTGALSSSAIYQEGPAS